MIKSFTVTNYLGDSIQLVLGEPEKSGFLIKSVSGLGPSRGNLNTTEVSTNDGSIFNSARLNQRNIVFNLAFVISSVGESIETVRQKSYKYFPIKKKLTILIETDNRTVRTTGYVESNEPDIFSSQEGAQISIICPDPYFYSTENDSTGATVFSGIEFLFEIRFSNEYANTALIEFGSIENKTENVITYDGDTEVGVTIHVHAIGAATNIAIYNTGTREVMTIDTDKLQTLTGAAFGSGDDIVICTVKGEKSITLIRSGVSTNILNCLDKDSSWFSLAKGDNVFAFTADTGTINLQFWIDND